jgi:hypothetical protein
MPGPDGLGPEGTPYDEFLQAEVGQDQRGTTVTVLSALARLGLDPWEVAAELSRQPRSAARNRIEALLSRLDDIPELRHHRATISARLTELLPGAKIHVATAAPPGAALGFGPILAFVLIVLFVVQTLLLGTNGPGG